jgi:Spherulation-specific family 4
MAGEPSGILVPGYVYPSAGAWDVLSDVGRAMMVGGLLVVANPGDGPGYDNEAGAYLPANPDYVSVIAALRAQCTSVLGYVHDCYANTNPPTADNCPRRTEILDDVDRWFSIYDVDGIFIDQVLRDDPSRAAQLVAEIRDRRDNAAVVLNPGNLPSREFVVATDPAIVVIREQSFDGYAGWPPDGWVRDRASSQAAIAASRLAIVAHSLPENVDDLDFLISVAAQYQIGWIYGQHLAGSNYNEFSTHLPAMAQRLDRCSRLGCIGFGHIFCRAGMSFLCFISRVRYALRTRRR